MPTRKEQPDPTFELIAATADPDEARHRHTANVTAWDDAARAYAARRELTRDLLRGGNSSLHPLELANLAALGPLREWCAHAVHLQCASGRDTLSLLTEGVGTVVGVDISPVHIGTAHWLASELGLTERAEFVCCDVLDTPHSLDASADLVYTGMGALCWIHDIAAWARVVARVLRPGGVLHVLDNHPMLWMWDDLADDLQVFPGASYFDQAGVSTSWSPGYLPELSADRPSKWERTWTFADIIGAVIDAGLEVRHLGEHRDGYFDAFPNLQPEEQARIPMTFTLLARRT